MQFETSDRFGNDEKVNGAYLADRNFQQDAGARRSRISFDNPINAFPEDFYAEAAKLSEAVFVGRLDAPEWHVQVFSRSGFLTPKLIMEASGQGTGEIVLPFKIKAGGGARFFVSITYRGTLQSDLLGFAVPAPEQPVPMGLSITTYNKPGYVRHNLEIIRSSNAYKAGLIDLLIVNNGDAIQGLPEDIEVMHPGNVGGTGGFSAGAAHFRDKGRRHFVIMDDDIVLLTDMVDRFFALSCFARGMHIGSLAEIENTPRRLVKEQGANVSPQHTFGLELVHPMIDIHGWFKDQIYDFREVDYSGWWALMVDLTTAPKSGVPAFYFIKRDDITFGFESRLAGTPTVVFPNLIVAHSEEGAASYFYYDVRNDLVMRARNNTHLGISIRGIAQELATKFMTYKLDEQRMFNQALSDFMSGPKQLEAQPVSVTLGKVRKLAGTRIPLPEDSPVISSDEVVSTRRMALAWLRPSSWRAPDPLPLVPEGHRACVTEIGGYIQMLPFSEKGIAHHRSMANIWSFLRGIALLGRLAITRGKIVARYQEGQK
ncbi:MAG: glycosyltransferase family 2 protein [Rhodobacteraceae bacterium]|nr:glycosyltransferase family 2 protein [Paracoccaceae bacterium]